MAFLFLSRGVAGFFFFARGGRFPFQGWTFFLFMGGLFFLGRGGLFSFSGVDFFLCRVDFFPLQGGLFWKKGLGAGSCLITQSSTTSLLPSR